MFLSARRCPHTGVLNFYSESDPYLAVGSISQRPRSGFTWRCYAAGAETSGRAPDMETAERRLTSFLLPIDEARPLKRIAC